MKTLNLQVWAEVIGYFFYLSLLSCKNIVEIVVGKSGLKFYPCHSLAMFKSLGPKSIILPS